MALLSVVVLSAVRTGVTVWNKSTVHLGNLHQSRTVTELLHAQIRGAVPLFYRVSDGERRNLLAFEGDRDHVRFVSRNSFADGPGAVPRWIEIRWLATAQDKGDLVL